MLASWTELLPVFVFKWLARRKCELMDVQGRKWAQGRPDVLVRSIGPSSERQE